mgnify:CR=1 FL=1
MEVPIARWNYKDDNNSTRHLGPMAQDFYQAFGLGKDEKHIASLDMAGVALASIQALQQQVKEKDRIIERNNNQIERNNAQIAVLQTQLKQMQATLAAVLSRQSQSETVALR